jgi:hypothetical protein
MSMMFVPLPEQKSSGCRLASTTSACRVIAQKWLSSAPSSGIAGIDMRAIGRCWRRTVNAASRSASGRDHHSMSSNRAMSSTAGAGVAGGGTMPTDRT